MTAHQACSHRPCARPRGDFYFDNLTLVPASLLPFKDEWQRIANDLPKGSALFVVPDDDTPLRRRMRSVALHLRRRGRRISAVSISRFSSPP